MSPGDFSCCLAARGSYSAGRADMPALRQSVTAKLAARGVSVNLRHADEQGLAAIAAILDAIGDTPISRFQSWGVVSAPQTPGRSATRHTLARFCADGAWGVSPQIIPSYSLHSIAGLVSVCFRMTGANIGVGGLVGLESEAFTIAATQLDATCPGVWLVLTGWESAEETTCRAAALALASSSLSGDRLAVVRGSVPGGKLTLAKLADHLSAGSGDEFWALDNGWGLQITRDAARRIAA